MWNSSWNGESKMLSATAEEPGLEAAIPERPKLRPLTDEQLEVKRAACEEKLIKNISVLSQFQDDLEPHKNREFVTCLKSLDYQYFSLQKYRASQSQKALLRSSNADVLVRQGVIVPIGTILKQLVTLILSEPSLVVPDTSVTDPTTRLLNILLNNSDISAEFSVAICESDTLMTTLYQLQSVLVAAYTAPMPPTLRDNDPDPPDPVSQNHLKLLRISTSTLYNTLIHDSAANLEKIRQMKFFDILKQLLNCKNERIKITALLFTVYVVDESESALFKSDQSSLTYLLNLFKDALKSPQQRANGLSLIELARGIEKLSKNDENKQLLVDLGLLPLTKKLMDHDSMKMKELSLSILWSLAFDERNCKIINDNMSGDLLGLKHLLINEHHDTKPPGDFICTAESSPKLPPRPPSASAIPNTICGSVLRPAPLHPPILLSQKAPVGEEKINKDELKLMSNKSRSKKVAAPQIKKKVKAEEEELEEEVEEDDSEELGAAGGTVQDPQDKVKVIVEKINCMKMMDGLMWTLGDVPKKNRAGRDPKFLVKSNLKNVSEDDSEGHFMISYSWANSDIVLKIYEAMMGKGYKMWIDKYNMSETENLMESMARAVEESTAVIVCVSSNYKDSPNCRAEAQYASIKKKHLVPVMVQKKYRPDGWLGFCITGLQYCDFKGRYTFEDAFGKMQDQLKRVGTIKSTTEKSVDTVDKVTPTKTHTETKVEPKRSDAYTWTHAEVNDWFKRLEINSWGWRLQYAGPELCFLIKLQDLSPDSFLDICRTELALTDLRDLRLFHEGLRLL